MRAEDASNEWGASEYLLARIEFDLQCIALRGTGSKARMVRTPLDDERLKRMRERAPDPDELADALGIPKDKRL